MKNVLMVTPRFRPSIGGVENHVLKVAEELTQRGINVTVLSCSHTRNLLGQETIGRIRVVRIPYGWDRNPALAYMWMVRNRSIFLRYDIAHIHDPLPLLFWYLPLIILKPNARRYATFHGFERDPIPLHFKLIRKIARRLVQGVICIGNWISTEYGIECDGTTVGAVEPLNLECKTRSGAVFVGRLETDTGLLEYIDSLHILKVQHDIDLNMVVCGSGSLRQQALDLAHTKSISTDFRGFVPNPREVMNACQVCLAAGYLSILEAMSLGLPVVGFSKTPLRYEYLKTIAAQGGPISIQSSPEGVAQEIAKIIKKPDLSAKMGEKGKAFAAMMSWQRMTEMYLRLWV